MADRIRMSQSEMKSAAKIAKDTAGKQGEVITTMNNLLKTLGKSWEGDAFKGYEARYNTIKKSLISAQDLLKEINQNLLKTAKIMEDTDKKIGAQYKSNG